MENFIQEALDTLVTFHSLSTEAAFDVMGEIMAGGADPIQVAALLTALCMKGETIPEITGFAKQMREHATQIQPQVENLVDTCGTGGDHHHTFNISTVSALVAAAAGVPIAKHGNRAASSHCGSADLLEALGVKLDLPPEKVKIAIETLGFGFMFAPLFHTAMKHVVPIRKALKIRTIFNILGPLTNPAGAKRQLLGVFSRELVPMMAEVLKALGSEEVLVVHGEEGLDEISICGKTYFAHLKNGKIMSGILEPETVKLPRYPLAAIQTTGLDENVKLTQAILGGEAKGAPLEAVLLNAGAAIWIGGKANSLQEGVETARVAIHDGRAKKRLAALVTFS